MSTSTLLVTGASGQLGRRALEFLLEAKVGRLVATTRTPQALSDFAAQGVEVRKADFDDPKSLVGAFAEVDRMLFVSTMARGPGIRLSQHLAAIDAAKHAGVSEVVYTSFSHPEPPTPIVVMEDTWRTEEALAKSGLRWTALRNNLYTDILLASLPSAVARGVLTASAGTGGAAWITREDCARAAAAAMLSGKTRGVIEITGPAVVTYRDIARILSKLADKAIEYLPMPPAELWATMTSAGVPEAIAAVAVSFEIGMAEGKLGPATNAFTELTGCAPMSVEQFLNLHLSKLLGGANARQSGQLEQGPAVRRPCRPGKYPASPRS